MATNQLKATDFKDLPERDRTEFFALLSYAILRHPSCFAQAQAIIDFAEKRGVYTGVKHGIVKIVEEVEKGQE